MLGRSPISSAPISGLQTGFIPQVTGGGGWILEAPTGRGKRERIREERERLGIIPKAVAKVIEKVAERKIEVPDLKLETALHQALERKNLAYRAYYAEALRLEIEARRLDEESKFEANRITLNRQRDEEEAILTLLLH